MTWTVRALWVLLCLSLVAALWLVPKASGEHEKWSGHTASYWHFHYKKAHHSLIVTKQKLHNLRRAHRRSIVVIRPSVLHAIALAATTYGVSYDEMVTVARCESGLDPNLAPNSATATGLFQFLFSTWAHTPYAGYSIYDAQANALAAAWLVRQDGGWTEWVCKP